MLMILKKIKFDNINYVNEFNFYNIGQSFISQYLHFAKSWIPLPVKEKKRVIF